MEVRKMDSFANAVEGDWIRVQLGQTELIVEVVDTDVSRRRMSNAVKVQQVDVGSGLMNKTAYLGDTGTGSLMFSASTGRWRSEDIQRAWKTNKETATTL